MVFFEWKDEYELGLPHIDLQHTMIVNMMNELFVTLGSSETEETIRKTLEKMLLYVEEHFASEEAAMLENNYPEFDSHFREHEAYRARVKELHQRHHADEKIAAHELIEFLKDWFQNHIAEVDKRFGNYVYTLSEEARIKFFQ